MNARIGIDDETLRHYLLGELDEPAMVEVESALFTSDAILDRLLALEEELIDRVSIGSRSASDAQRFTQRFQRQSDRENGTEFDRRLREYVSRRCDRRGSA